VANETHKDWENKPPKYNGPEWGLTDLELIEYIKPLASIYGPVRDEWNVEVCSRK